MSSKRAKTLAAVFASLVSGTIAWADIESLLIAVGCKVIEGSGFRVWFVFGNEAEFFRRPHPDKEAKRYQVRAARDFLVRIRNTP